MSAVNQSLTKAPIFDDFNWRFEYKYHLNINQYLAIKSAITPHMIIDDYTLVKPDKKYFVSSLYFDSLFLNAFHEKLDGNSERLKLRLRTYEKTPHTVDFLKAEIKIRKNVTTEKYVTLIEVPDYQYFMSNKHWPKHFENNPILDEFERYYHLKTQTPMVLIQYEREGYRARSKEQIRITFDHRVRSTQSQELFPSNPILREHYPGVIVLEIKCNKQQPNWLHALVQRFGLCIIPNSKYAQGIVFSLPSVVTPSWSS